MVIDFLMNQGLYYSQGHTVGWLIGLVFFLVVTVNSPLTRGQNPVWYVSASALSFFGAALSIISLEATKAALVDFVLANQLGIGAAQVFATCALAHALWLILYLTAFWHFKKKIRRAPIAVFERVASLRPAILAC
jgi:hypothetical protein